NDIYLLEVTTTASSSNSSKWLNSEIYSNPYSQEYKWEKYVHESFGNWLTSLSAKYPNLIYYSLQPTFAQPELLTYLYFPSTRKVDYGRQILSNTATGTANGWYSAAQSGGAPAYIHLNGSQTIGDTTFISVSYYDADGVSDKSEGINLAQIVVNDYVDWDGPKVNSSSTKEGIRIMYSNLGDSNFEPNSVYIYQHGCTSGCIYGWKKVNKNSNLTISSSLNVSAQISYVKTTRDELKITFVIKDPSNKFGNSNLYAWTEGRISGKSTNFSENFDLLSGYSTQPDVNNLVYKDARFKYLGKI
ncbi:hypothetical protein KC909_05900, partial [Candidatus Dojkabacteria bacterium]|nr:hypothetical protein [Candidatus Dojkabacteria bacterium]